MTVIDVHFGEIARTRADMIVNPAAVGVNAGPVDATVRLACGPQLCAMVPAERARGARASFVTDGFDLPARLVAHVVVPEWRNGRDEVEQAAELAPLDLDCPAWADAHAACTVAFPVLGSAGHSPFRISADAAAEAMAEWIDRDRPRPETGIFVCPSPYIVRTFQHAAKSWGSPIQSRAMRAAT